MDITILTSGQETASPLANGGDGQAVPKPDGAVPKAREKPMLRTRSLGPADNREAGKREAGLRHREQLVASPRSFRQIANAISGISSEEPLDRPRSSPSATKRKTAAEATVDL